MKVSILVLAAASMALAACGAGSPTQAASPATDTQKAQAAYADCLRQHGIPANSNGSVTIRAGSGPSQSQVSAALQACQSQRPSGLQQAGGSGNQQTFDRLLQWAACMRQHGANVPDPQRDPSSGGIRMNVPSGQDQQTLQAAQQACQSLSPQQQPTPSN